MSIGTIERTALAGGDGDDSPYIKEGVDAAEEMLRLELAYGPGEFVVEPVAFAPESLGQHQRGRRLHVGIQTGRLVMHKRSPIRYTPRLGRMHDQPD